MKEKSKVLRLTLPTFKTYYEATVIKLLWYCQNNSQIYQCDRRESPEMDLYKYSYLIFDKGTRKYSGEKY
jgi:hypothetical protein